MTTTDVAPARTAFAAVTRIALWDSLAECSMVMATPSAEPELFAKYHRGAVASYARFGVSDAVDPDPAGCAADTALFWALTDIEGTVVGGVRAKGPLRSPDEAHATVEWAGQPGEAQVRAMLAERIPDGVLEIKTAWLAKNSATGRHRTKMIARCMFHAMAVSDVQSCMATSAAHILDQWGSSGGVIAPIPPTPYPDERYETAMMWWDRSTFAEHGEPDQVEAVVREMAHLRRAVTPDRSTRWRDLLVRSPRPRVRSTRNTRPTRVEAAAPDMISV